MQKQGAASHPVRLTVLLACISVLALGVVHSGWQPWVLRTAPEKLPSQAKRAVARRLNALAAAGGRRPRPVSTLPARDIEWLHIPKAGTSFGNTLLLWACPELRPRTYITETNIRLGVTDECRARFRRDPSAPRPHLFVGEHASLANRTDAELSRVYTMLRSPNSRLASGFHFQHHISGLNATVEEICEDSAASTRIHTAPGVQTRMVLGEEMIFKEAKRPKDGGHHFLVRGGPGASAVEAACARLRQFAFVGITDFWAASVCLFHAMHGGRTHRAVELANVRQGVYSQVEESVKAADCGDEADQRLFECALELFLENMARHPRCIWHMRAKIFNSTGPDSLLRSWLEQYGGRSFAGGEDDEGSRGGSRELG